MAGVTGNENSIADEQVGTEAELPEWTGEGLGEPPPGHGAEAFTDEALDADPEVSEAEDLVDDSPNQAPAQAAPPAGEANEQVAGIEHDPRFKNLRRLQVQQAEELKAERERAAQMEAALQQLAPLLEGNQSQEAPFDPFDPTSVQRFIEHQVAQRTAQAQQVVQTEQQRAALVADIDAQVTAFKQAHPEVVDESPIDRAIAAVVQDLQTPENGGRPDVNLFPVTVDNLEVAYALAQDQTLYRAVQELDLFPDEETLQIARDAIANPVLFEEFKAQPQLLDNDEGIRVAYRRAGMAQQIASLPGQVQQAAEAGLKKAMPQQMRRQAHVETGGTGAPASSAPGARPEGDEFDEVIAVHRQDNNSIFT